MVIDDRERLGLDRNNVRPNYKYGCAVPFQLVRLPFWEAVRPSEIVIQAYIHSAGDCVLSAMENSGACYCAAPIVTRDREGFFRSCERNLPDAGRIQLYTDSPKRWSMDADLSERG